MKKFLNSKGLNIFFSLSLCVLILLLPIFLNPELYLSRNNDLQEFFWPLINFTKYQILTSHIIPLWNNQILSGYPLFADPQSPLFYLPNIIFLILPLNTAFLLSLSVHLFFGSLGMYLISKNIFRFSKNLSLLISLLYTISPRLSAFIEAGHVGQINAYAWIPYVFLSTYNLATNPKKSWSLLYILSIASLFLTHSITFAIFFPLSVVFYLAIQFDFKNFRKFKIISYAITIFLLFGFISIAAIPQFFWSKDSTRTLLIEHPDVYPKWNSFREFLSYSINPLLIPNLSLSEDSEKWLPLGITGILLSSLGFYFLNIRLKIFTFSISLISLLLSLNNLSPFYNFLLKQGWYDLLRVTTRFWILIQIISIFLSALAIQKLNQKKINQIVIRLIILLLIVENLLLSWTKITTPITQSSYAPKEVYKFIKNDSGQFRIFCTTKCFSQKDISENNLETIEGYNTLIQKNYFYHSWELTKSYYNYYTLSIPSLGAAAFGRIQPSAKSLGEYNVKYIISPHLLTDKNFVLIKKIDLFYIYKNNEFKTRAYYRSNKPAQISFFSPNKIEIDTPDKDSDNLIISEVYSSGWKAYLNNTEPTKIQETPEALRQVRLKSNTTSVLLEFKPFYFEIGKVITIITILIMSLVVYIYEK